jgi:ATP-binding cassette subfamily B protein
VALLAAGALVALATGIARKYLRGLNKAVSAADGKVSGFLQEIFEKLLMVQAMNVEQEVERRGDGLMEERYALQKKRWKITLTANTCISVLGYVSGFAALVWCSFQLAGGSMTFGELTAVTQLVSQLQSPFVHLSGVLPKYIAMTAACDRLMELEKACEVEQLQVQDVDYEKLTHIRAEGLSFSYGRDQVFSDCDFSLPKGAFAVITGQSGIGKSTLLKLLLGIFPRPDRSDRLLLQAEPELHQPSERHPARQRHPAHRHSARQQHPARGRNAGDQCCPAHRIAADHGFLAHDSAAADQAGAAGARDEAGRSVQCRDGLRF